MNTLSKKPEQRPEADANRQYMIPPVDIWESNDAYVLKADMPGVTKREMEVLLEDNELTIVGRRDELTPPGDALYRESKPHSFRRVFELDPSVDSANIKAHMDQGVLTLHLPKAERLKPRKILVID